MATYEGRPETYDSLLEQGYQFDLNLYFRQGWEIFKSQGWAFFGFYLIGSIASGIVGQVPLLGAIAQIGISACIMAGIYLYADRINKGQPAEFANFFDGFRDFLQQWVGGLLVGLLAALPLLTGMALFFISRFEELSETFGNMSTDPVAMLTLMGEIFLDWRVLLALVGTVFISLLFTFVTPLISLGRLKATDAMAVSRKAVLPQWHNFLILNLIFIPIHLLGVLMLIFGVFATIAFQLCVMYVAYDHILGQQGPNDMGGLIEEIGHAPEA